MRRAFPRYNAVRDLASGRQLLWQPVKTMTAEVTESALSSLFAEHGRPLVLKSDNGSAFIAETTKVFLKRAGVFCLFSPTGLPSYNGSREAGIGSLKTRTQAHRAGASRTPRPSWQPCGAA
jgi:transposase InsO family protein